jgi:hypothetical protein
MAAAISENPRARLTGVAYLLYFLIAMAAESFRASDPLASESLNVISYGCYIVVTLLLYRLFKPVSARVSLFAAGLSIVGCAIGIAQVFHLLPAAVNALLVFGCYCIVIGYLIYNSTFLPRAIGVLMMFAGIGWLTFVLPASYGIRPFVELLGIVAEAALMLWLLFFGVNVERWRVQRGNVG